MMATMTSADCYAEAKIKTTIITCQRKLGRFLQRISEKERYAALYQSDFMCKRYDEEIEELYERVAELEGYVLARELELEQIADKRREDEAQRMARILQISGPALVPTPFAAVMPPQSPSATPRTEQLPLFGPGPAKLDTRPSGSQSANHDWAVESDVAVGFEHFTEAAEEAQTSHSAVKELDLPEADKVVAKTEQKIPFTFAYAVDPQKPDSQKHDSPQPPSSQSSDSQPPSSQSSDSQSPSVIARDSVEGMEADSGTAFGRGAVEDSQEEGYLTCCESSTNGSGAQDGPSRSPRFGWQGRCTGIH